jgi:predicted ATP-grasp superfamily ATP-dependent carboligase
LPIRDELIRVTIPFPTIQQLRAICDKRLVLSTAAGLGIAVPRQTLLSEAVIPDDQTLATLDYPVVLKPSRSVVGGPTGRMKVAVTYARDGSELRRQIALLPVSVFPLLLQQRIIGRGEGVSLLRWDGELRAAFAHRRIREKPPTGGVSVYRESMPLDPELFDQARQLLEAFDWHGVAMVEFKRESASSRAYLMEVNGRFWGSMQLAIDAGVDFPALLVDAALGIHRAPVLTYRSAVRSRWWWGDVDHFLARMRGSREEVGSPPALTGRTRDLVEFITSWRPRDRNEVLRFTDPRPFVRESLDWVGRVVQGARRRRSR